MILQLARTTPYLAGQFKLDVELFINENEIFTGECHVSPLSDNLGETDSHDVPFFNCKLSDHIKRLRERLGDAFWGDSPTLTSEKIMYQHDSSDLQYVWKDTYDHTYQAGVSRMRYNKYKKQFQLLCPVWCDDVGELLSTKWFFKVRGWDTDVLTSSTLMHFSDDLRASLIEYLYNLSPDFININLDRNEFIINGLEASTGTVVTKDVSYYMKNLLDRERPVIETDSMLCQLLPSNDLIARQLINFNFCFNMPDIMPPYLANEMQMDQWTVWCDMERHIAQTEFFPEHDAAVEFMDLYTNYWHIPSFVSDNENGHFDDNKNALDYLEDDKCIDYINLNKVTQPIYHFALRENPDYLYNFYNGFSPIVSSADGDSLRQGLFFNQANPYQKEYSSGSNTLNWCKIKDFRSMGNLFSRLANMYASNPGDFTVFEMLPNKVAWINGMKFSEQPAHIGPVRANIVYANQIEINSLGGGTGGAFIVKHADDCISFLVDPINSAAMEKLSLWTILNSGLAGSSSNSSIATTAIDTIESIFKYYVYPWKIKFDKSLYAERVESPAAESKEIRYYKSDINVSSYIYRYTGSLMPMTVRVGDTSNYNWDFFYKTIDSNFLSTEDGKKYNEMMKTGFAQKYPSVGYFPLEPVKASYFPDPERYPTGYEVKWYKNSRIWNLPEEVTVSVVVPTGSDSSEDFYNSVLKTKLSEIFSVNPSSASSGFYGAFEAQLKGAYSHKSTWDYSSDDNLSDIMVNITYNLR